MASACLLSRRSSWEDVCLSWDWKVGKSYFRSRALLFPSLLFLGYQRSRVGPFLLLQMGLSGLKDDT